MLSTLHTLVLLVLALPGLALPQGVTLSACFCPELAEAMDCCTSCCDDEDEPMGIGVAPDCEGCHELPLDQAPAATEVAPEVAHMVPAPRRSRLPLVVVPPSRGPAGQEAAPGAVPGVGLQLGCRPLRT